jgi:hypothetical protein
MGLTTTTDSLKFFRRYVVDIRKREKAVLHVARREQFDPIIRATRGLMLSISDLKRQILQPDHLPAVEVRVYVAEGGKEQRMDEIIG